MLWPVPVLRRGWPAAYSSVAALDLRRLNTHSVSEAPGGSREGRDGEPTDGKSQPGHTSFLQGVRDPGQKKKK